MKKTEVKPVKKSLVAYLIVLLLIMPVAVAFAQVIEAQVDLHSTDVDDKGFLLEGEDVYENPDEGIWYYNSPSLRVEIKRYYDKSANLTWTEAEIFSDGSDVFRMTPKDSEHWMKVQDWPAAISKENGVVFSVNSDYAHTRIAQKSIVGVIVRDGKIISEKTRKKDANKFPNLDTLALFPDGDMKVFYADEHTAKEYIEMGAVDVLAFGPFLIRDGELNEAGLKKYGASKAPRTAVGMVEKGHYWAMMLEGRHDKSKGAGISFLANKLYEKGCTVAMNLDGGQTATMVFMGKQIIHVGQTSAANASARKTAEVLGIGYSAELANMD